MKNKFNFLQISKQLSETIYYRNGFKSYLCLSRKKLIKHTPEEEVRQSFVYYLHQLGYHLNNIEVEVPLKNFGVSSRDRVDIIVYDTNNLGDNGENQYALMLIECKSPNVNLTERTENQILKYNEILGAKFLILTNGNFTEYFEYSDIEQNYQLIEKLPTQEELFNNEGWRSKKIIEHNENYKIVNHLELNNDEITYLKNGIIGEDTEESIFSPIANLYNLLIAQNSKPFKFKNDQKYNIKNIVDKGLRYVDFGVFGGGAYLSHYRYFTYETDENGTNIFSLTIKGTNKLVNHPIYGNRKGKTLLVCGLDDDEKSHISLELRLDKFLSSSSNEKYTLWHDGTISVSKFGSVKKDELINFIISSNSDLKIVDNKIIIWEFENNEHLLASNLKNSNLIINLMKYSLLRDEFRKQKINKLNSKNY